MFALINLFNTVFTISGAILVLMLVAAVISIIKNVIVAIIQRAKRYKKSK